MGSVKREKGIRTGVNTRVIHLKENFSRETGSIMPPIFPTSTFVHGNEGGFDYTRSGNPNFKILESVLSDLEECQFASVFSSGVAAITAIVSSLKTGDLIFTGTPAGVGSVTPGDQITGFLEGFQMLSVNVK